MERTAAEASSRERLALYLGLTALLVAAGAHALIWSGGFVALPLAWLLAIGAVVVVVSTRRRSSLPARSRWGLIMAVVVLGGSAAEFAVLAIRRAIE
ncbi:MAG: hypothetical protein WD273_04265 [Trueperaceae bacterium]